MRKKQKPKSNKLAIVLLSIIMTSVLSLLFIFAYNAYKYNECKIKPQNAVREIAPMPRKHDPDYHYKEPTKPKDNSIEQYWSDWYNIAQYNIKPIKLAIYNVKSNRTISMDLFLQTKDQSIFIGTVKSPNCHEPEIYLDFGEILRSLPCPPDKTTAIKIIHDEFVTIGSIEIIEK